MSVPRNGAAAACTRRHLYVCGGTDGADVWARVERFDPVRGARSEEAWQAMPDMRAGRSGLAAAALNGSLF
eukprot:5802779-Alexandrium_andersonii.AAC.1